MLRATGCPIIGEKAVGMEIEHEFWIEQATRAIWAVELHDDVVTACYGPLVLGDVDEDLLESFDYSPGGAAWIEQHRERFSPFTPVIPYIPPT